LGLDELVELLTEVRRLLAEHRAEPSFEVLLTIEEAAPLVSMTPKAIYAQIERTGNFPGLRRIAPRVYRIHKGELLHPPTRAPSRKR
jgi:hypothetical protein